MERSIRFCNACGTRLEENARTCECCGADAAEANSIKLLRRIPPRKPGRDGTAPAADDFPLEQLI